MPDTEKHVRILYVNHRGETSWRTIQPFALIFEVSVWHPEPQWLLDAWDVGRYKRRSFAMSGIKEWKPCEHEAPVDAKGGA